MKFFLPDCLWTPGKVSGASFLYFNDQDVTFSLHPSVSVQMTGVDPFSFLPFLEKDAPPWKDSFLEFFGRWIEFRKSLQATREMLAPLRKDSFLMAQLSYNRGKLGWDSSRELIESSSLDIAEIFGLIDPYHASDELFSHIFFEKVLEARYGDIAAEEGINLGVQYAQRGFSADSAIVDFDWRPIREYCDGLFGRQSLNDILTQAYMFRMPLLRNVPSVLLSNPRLIPFLASLPVISQDSLDGRTTDLDRDVVAWEFFRQLVSAEVDPLEPHRIKSISKMVATRKSEIERLKNRCFDLANELADEKDLDKLVHRVRYTIRAKVTNEIQDLFQIDKKTLSALLTKIFSDEKNWIATSTFVYGLLSGGDALTASAAIYGLSNVGSNAAKQAADRRDKLSTSPYTLLYRMQQ
jgi:hypothetical protein